MIYVVRNGEIVYTVDAWYIKAEEEVNAWIKENGYVTMKCIFTQMGNMVIWVE